MPLLENIEGFDLEGMMVGMEPDVELTDMDKDILRKAYALRVDLGLVWQQSDDGFIAFHPTVDRFLHKFRLVEVLLKTVSAYQRHDDTFMSDVISCRWGFVVYSLGMIFGMIDNDEVSRRLKKSLRIMEGGTSDA